MKDFIGIVAAVILIIGIIFGLSCALNGIALWLYNVVLIPVFSAPAISFWQMFGLRWFINLLFGGGTLVKVISNWANKN